MRFTYIGPFDEVELDGVGVVKHGATIDVPARLAGRAPEDDDLGEGLLAQPSNWRPVGKKTPATTTTTPKEA